MGGIPKSQCQRCARRSWAVSNVLAAGCLLTERSFHSTDSLQAVIRPGESATWYEWIVAPLLLLCCQVLKARLPLPGAPNYIYFGRLFPFNYLTRWTETRAS
ncbi:hypothetical protein T07_13096 [Trichinella nelsoni]|uniref:Uncharacterized protein n=1 Tax=Trichinella nelsoni TaxID=6336 RepID=A0A0V0RJH2_9BILA|nr:hypothetical protein T07_13096 [Trichinella nelsoni]